MPERAVAGWTGQAPATAPASTVAAGTMPWLAVLVKGLGPLALLSLLLWGFLRWGPIGVFQQAFPPVEELVIERITFPRPGEMRVRVVNGGPQAVTIAQVLVDEAYWDHSLDPPDRTLERLERRTVTIPYPWVDGDPHEVSIVTANGLTFSRGVEVATQTPTVDARYLSTFALLGVYVGVIPVFLGFLWFPFLRSLSRKWTDFFLSLTIGLLVFLGVDAVEAAFETAADVAGAFQGPALVLMGTVGAVLALSAVGHAPRRDRAAGIARSPMYVAALIALGIGLHNLGEGLAIGTSYATGEIALGTMLVVGFLLHNTTEGLGIVAPLAGGAPRLRPLIALGAVAGVPTVLGAWIGGFTYSPLWTTVFYAIGAGAIAQVVYEIWMMFARREAGGGLTSPLNAAGFASGLLIMYITGLFVAA